MSFMRAFAKNAAFKGLGEILIRILSFAFVVMVARVLGDDGFGVINFSFSFALLFVVIVDFGLNPLMIRDGAKAPDRTRSLFVNLLLVKLGLAAVFAAAVLIARRWGSTDPETLDVVVWMMLFVMTNSFTEFINAVFHAHQKMQYEALVMTLQKLALLGFGILALRIGSGVQGVAAAYAAAGGLGVVIAGGILLRKPFLQGRWKWDPAFLKYIWQQALPLTVTTLFINLYFRIDMTLLNKLRSSAEVGWYGAAHKCIEVLMVVPAVLVVAAFPGFSKMFREDREKLAVASGKAAKLLMILGAPIAGGAWLVAKPLMVLVFGEAYAPSGSALTWLALALGMIFMNYLLSFLLISCERQVVNAFASGAAVAVSVAANLILIPRMGHVGAALSAAATELFLLVAYLTAVRRLLFPFPLLRTTLKVMAAVGIMLGASIWLKSQPVILVLGVAAIAYVGALFLVRVIDREDLALLGKAVGRKAV